MPRSHPPSLLTITARTIQDEPLFGRGDRVLVAVSGGPDSMTLLHALAHLRGRVGHALAAHGVDHGLRPEAAAELDRAEAFARTLEVPFDRSRVDLRPGGNLQARARDARYAALRRITRKIAPRRSSCACSVAPAPEASRSCLRAAATSYGRSSTPPARPSRLTPPDTRSPSRSTPRIETPAFCARVSATSSFRSFVRCHRGSTSTSRPSRSSWARRGSRAARTTCFRASLARRVRRSRSWRRAVPRGPASRCRGDVSHGGTARRALSPSSPLRRAGRSGRKRG
jgi:tRNA(Ile)-lysidine synthase